MTPTNSDAEIEKILWPHPFGGSPHKPVQVAVSSGLPPDGKTFVMAYSMATIALLAWRDRCVAEALARVQVELRNLPRHRPTNTSLWDGVQMETALAVIDAEIAALLPATGEGRE